MPRWSVGRALKKLRVNAGMTLEDARRVVRKSIDTVRNIENGDTSIDHNNLAALLQAYGADDQTTEDLLDRSERARKRGWWISYAPGQRMRMLLDIESVATAITSYNHFVWPGWLQTAEYANALFGKTAPFETEEARERFARLQPERYDAIFDRADPADVTALVDEAALLREVAAPAVMVQQLERVLAAPCEVRVIPLRATHPGVVTMSLMETSEVGPVGYVEGWRDSEIHVNGDDDDVQALSNIVREIGDTALPPADSRRMIEDLLEDWESRA